MEKVLLQLYESLCDENSSHTLIVLFQVISNAVINRHLLTDNEMISSVIHCIKSSCVKDISDPLDKQLFQVYLKSLEDILEKNHKNIEHKEIEIVRHDTKEEHKETEIVRHDIKEDRKDIVVHDSKRIK